ncbi:hypothetical protein ILYODFUR_010201 [Ilyodon furcidens]|uniref:Uncharacterized protein n=1 Tax=Ilyodon furcidens TaxID=33524 RepID=A0ABV0TLH7_9TELE
MCQKKEGNKKEKLKPKPVSGPVLDSNNVGKCFSQSEKKAQLPGCLSAVAAGLMFLRSDGRKVGRFDTTKLQEAQMEAETQTNTANPCSRFWSCRVEILDNVMTPHWQEFQGFASQWNAIYLQHFFRLALIDLFLEGFLPSCPSIF